MYRVKIVAQIMDVNKQANALSLELDDGTGRVDARYWLSPDAEEDENHQDNIDLKFWQEGVYVRVHGNLRESKNSDKFSFSAVSITPITDFNEITFHFLESVLHHIKNLKEKGDDIMDTSSTNSHAPNNEEDLQPLYATVLEIVQRASQTYSEGASLGLIFEQMNPYGIQEEEVRGAIQYLASEGHLYPTFDEEHFKA